MTISDIKISKSSCKHFVQFVKYLRPKIQIKTATLADIHDILASILLNVCECFRMFGIEIQYAGMICSIE